MENTEKRLYTFSHFMLSPMAKGIQTLHSTVELFNKYVPNPGNNDEVTVTDDLEKDANSILWDWSLNHKTVISLNPGVSGDLEDLVYFLEDPENFYPWADFSEDEYSLKGVRTAVSIVLPEKIYNTSSLYRTKNLKINIETGRFDIIDYERTTTEELEMLHNYGKFNSFEFELVQILFQYRLAS